MIAELVAAMLVAGTPSIRTDLAAVSAAVEAGAPQEPALYKEGTSALDRSDWDAAIKAFGEVARQKGERADAALYWQAYAFNKSGRREDALKTLAALKSAYPQSRWLRDGRALEMEVRQASGQTPQVEPDDNDELKLMALRGLMNADPNRAIPIIKQMLAGAPSDKLRDRALFVLAQSGSDEGRQLLVTLAKSDPNPETRVKAIQQLGLFGGEESRQTLVDIYSTSQDVRARKAVLHAFMISGDRTRLAELARKEPSPELRREAINQLGVSGGRAELWQLYQQDKDLSVRRAIINALFVGGGADQLSELAMKETDPQLRREAIERLGLTGTSSAGTLKTIYTNEKDPALKRAVLNAFFVQGNAAALVEIARREQDPGLKREAVEKLSLMGSKEATDYMMELLK